MMLHNFVKMLRGTYDRDVLIDNYIEQTMVNLPSFVLTLIQAYNIITKRAVFQNLPLKLKLLIQKSHT